MSVAVLVVVAVPGSENLYRHMVMNPAAAAVLVAAAIDSNKDLKQRGRMTGFDTDKSLNKDIGLTPEIAGWLGMGRFDMVANMESRDLKRGSRDLKRGRNLEEEELVVEEEEERCWPWGIGHT